MATSGSSSRSRVPFDGLSATEAALLERAFKTSVDPSRPNYPFSVIGRGVYNANELGAAMARDHVVAAHYKGVSLDEVRVERVTEPRYAYVSYRKGDDIFWTKNKVRLNPGEMILTDGEMQIRARCGNCISTQPMLPTSDEEPESVTLEPLLPPEEAQDGVPLVASFPIISPFSGIPGVTQVNSPQGAGGGIRSRWSGRRRAERRCAERVAGWDELLESV